MDNRITLPIQIQEIGYTWLFFLVLTGILVINIPDKSTGIAAVFAGVSAMMAALIAFYAATSKVRSDEKLAAETLDRERFALHLACQRIANLSMSDVHDVQDFIERNTDITYRLAIEYISLDNINRHHMIDPCLASGAKMDKATYVQLIRLAARVDAVRRTAAAITKVEFSDQALDSPIRGPEGWYGGFFSVLSRELREVDEMARALDTLAAAQTGHDYVLSDEELVEIAQKRSFPKMPPVIPRAPKHQLEPKPKNGTT